MTQYQIRVTQDHIDSGEPGNKGWCAIALAIKEAIPSATVPVINNEKRTIAFTDKGVGDFGARYTWRMDDQAAAFVAPFDKGQVVRPFNLQLTNMNLIESKFLAPRNSTTRRKPGTKTTGPVTRRYARKLK